MELALLVIEANFKEDEIISLLRPEFLQKKKKSKEAALRLEEIIKLRQDNYYAWEKLLLVYYDLKDFENLQNRGAVCASKFNRSIIAKMLYATGAMENENYNIALEELRKADILAGDNRELKLQILTLRADTYYRMKNYEEAFKAFDEGQPIEREAEGFHARVVQHECDDLIGRLYPTRMTDLSRLGFTSVLFPGVDPGPED